MPTRRTQRHLVAAWNPSFRPDTVESHLDRLLEAIERYRRGECGEDDVYVWWAKVRSPNRHHSLPHVTEILDIDVECDRERQPDREVHLYVTDYDSLYVGNLGEITTEDVRELPDERRHIPAYYFEEKIEVDCWFRLFDLRRLTASDRFTVIDELEKLRNVRHYDRPVSIYGGMVDLPLIVIRPDGARFFDEKERVQLAGEKFWAEFDAGRVGLGQMERELRENHFGDDAWRALEPTARAFIATAEKIYRDHRTDSSFDFTPVIVEFSKAFEVQCNSVLRRALGSCVEADRLANIDGRTCDVANYGALSLNDLAHVIAEEPRISRALKLRLRHGEWFSASLPPILRKLAEVRNPAAHHRRVLREEARRVRDEMIGVGCQSAFAELAGVSPLSGSGRRFTPQLTPMPNTLRGMADPRGGPGVREP